MRFKTSQITLGSIRPLRLDIPKISHFLAVRRMLLMEMTAHHDDNESLYHISRKPF